MFPLLPPYPAAEGLAARFAFNLHAARVYVASRVRQMVPGLGEFLIRLRFEALINDWLQRRLAAIVALIGRIEAGTQRPPRPYKPRETKTDPTWPGTQRKATVSRPRALSGWLCVLGREVRFPGLWLANLLEETAAREMVAAYPQRVRLIRPVLRMLGEQAPAWMPIPSKRPRPARPARMAGRPEPAARRCRERCNTRSCVVYRGGAREAVCRQHGEALCRMRRIARPIASHSPLPTVVGAVAASQRTGQQGSLRLRSAMEWGSHSRSATTDW